MAAKNWTLKEAVKVIVDGTNTEAMQELGKRFPLTSLAIAKMGNNEGANVLFGAMPDHMTMLKMERSLKEGLDEVEEDQDEESTAADESTGDEDLESMSTKELMKLCDKRGIKVPHYGKNKQFYLNALNGATDEVEESEEEEAQEEAPDYSKMTAPELYKLCKKRGIKVEAKQKAVTYVAALKKADAATEDEEGWGDDDEEEAPVKKPAKDTKKTPVKKEAKKTALKKAAPADDEDDEDDEDDWDI